LYLPGCDVSGDSVCNVVDALYIMQCEVGISNPLCPTEGEGLASTSPAVFDTQAVVSIDSTKLHQFERVESPLTVELPDGMSVAAVTVDVFYESAIVRAVACTPAGPAAFSMCHINQQENSVRFTWLAPLGTTSLVTLGSITFEGVAEGAAKLAVNVTGFVDATGVALPVTAEGSEIVVVATLRLRAGLSD
jgi:hypothetical protein